MREPLRNLKVRLNYLLDRVIDFCDMILMDAYLLPSPVQALIYRVVRWLGNVCLLLLDFPRLSVTRFSADNWCVIHVGTGDNLAQLSNIFFEGPVEQKSEGRIALWNLSSHCQRWLDDGVDLVICELSPLLPWQPKAPVRFVVPLWINMVIDLPSPLENILSGNKRKRVRQRVNKGSKAGFQYRFSRDRVDFDTFHFQMYRPYISNRHGDRAAVSTYQHQWDRWFQRGGLVVVTQNEKAVGAALCYIANGVCYSIEGGVLDASAELLKHEINGMIDWYGMVWAHQQGARQYNMGGTRPWRSDRIYLYKRQWGAEPNNRHRKLQRRWTFLGKNVPPELRDHLNRIGFISEVANNQYYGIHLHTDILPLNSARIEQLHEDWRVERVDGVMIVSPHAPTSFSAVPVVPFEED